MDPKILFVTGTDTGVGKTVATALLLCHLRNSGARALALKPFCSGGRGDARLLCDLQDGDLTLNEVNPFFFPEPVAPLVAARQRKQPIPLQAVVRHIDSVVRHLRGPSGESCSHQKSKTKKQNYLLIEGSGGLLVPLGEGYTVRDLIARLACEVVVVSRNQLGTINHTLLTVEALQRAPRAQRFVVRPQAPVVGGAAFMDSAARDVSRRSNAAILSQLLAPVRLIGVPFLGRNCEAIPAMKKNAKKIQKTLARFFL